MAERKNAVQARARFNGRRPKGEWYILGTEGIVQIQKQQGGGIGIVQIQKQQQQQQQQQQGGIYFFQEQVWKPHSVPTIYLLFQVYMTFENLGVSSSNKSPRLVSPPNLKHHCQQIAAFRAAATNLPKL